MRSIAAAVASAVVLSGAAVPALADTTAFLNVNVISMHGDEVQFNQTVVVESGQISVIGPV